MREIFERIAEIVQGRALACIINGRSAHVRNYALSFPTLLFLLIRETNDNPAMLVNC